MNVPTFSEWKQSNPGKSINDYFSAYPEAKNVNSGSASTPSKVETQQKSQEQPQTTVRVEVKPQLEKPLAAFATTKNISNADLIVSFKISEAQFERAVFQWLAAGDYTPDDIIENIINANNAMYLPMYFFNMDYFGTMTASVGYPRQVDYYEWNDYMKRNERRTRTETDWHPFSQNVLGEVSALCFAGKGIPDQMAEHAQQTEFRQNEFIQFNQSDWKNANFIDFGFSPQQVWAERGDPEGRKQAWNQSVRQLPGNQHRNISVNVSFREKLFRSVLIPYWVFFYQYEGTNYYVFMDGNNPNRISGSKPEDSQRKNKVQGIRLKYWSIGIITSLVALFIKCKMNEEDFSFEKPNWIIFVVGLVITGIFTSVEVGKIKNKSIKTRQEKLARKYS